MVGFNVKEAPIVVVGPVGMLEGVFHPGESDGPLAAKGWVAVLCHPHPQHGGTMDNKVVTTLMRTYRDIGVGVVRFNFRGVGRSEGHFDHANGEKDDLRAVIQWAEANLCPQGILIAGFSFGSSIAAQVSYEVPLLRHLILVAPPVERYPYDQHGVFSAPLCVIQGDKDERVVASGVYQWFEGLAHASAFASNTLLRYPDASHFFHGYLSALKQDLTRALLDQLSH